MKGVKMGKGYAYSLLLLVVTALFFAANLFWGAVDIPYGAVIDILSGRETDHQSWAYNRAYHSVLQRYYAVLLCRFRDSCFKPSSITRWQILPSWA